MSELDYKSGDKIAEAIDRRIVSVAKQVYEKSPNNKTKYGKVLSKKDGLFTIEIEKAIYPNVPALRNVGNINIGEVVVCMVPNNQFSNIMVLGVADGTIIKTTEGEGSSVNVIDNVNSSSSVDALSANQGRVLNEKISTINNNITKIEDKLVSKTSELENDGDGKSPFATVDYVNQNAGGESYDDTEIRGLIDSLEENKTDKSELENYLPLTAGSDKPLTGDLYVQDGDNTKNIYIGNHAQIRASGTNSLIISAGASISFRPAGTASTAYSVDLLGGYLKPRTTENVSLGQNTGAELIQFNNIYGKNIYKNGKEVSTKEYVDNLVSTIPKFSVEVVESLPTENISTTTVYLVASGSEEQNLYSEYIYIQDKDNPELFKWEKLGEQRIDLSNYPTKEELREAVTTALVDYYTSEQVDGFISTLQENINKKLDRVDGSTSSQLYGVSNQGGQEMYPVTKSVSNNAVVRRTGKQIKVIETPVSDDDATSKSYVDNLVSTIPKFSVEVVESLPTENISTTTVYLVASGSESQNLYIEYIYINGTWEKLGEQRIDLSNYPTKEELTEAITSALVDYYTSEQVDTLVKNAKTKYKKVISLPTFAELEDNTIYLLRHTKSDGSVYYTEHVYVDDQWEQFGTDVDSAFASVLDNTTKITNTLGGFAGGRNATARTTGGAIGNSASTGSGGAVGEGTMSSIGFAGGYNAKTQKQDGSGYSTIDAIQLGTGTNSIEKSLQVYDDNIYNASTHTLTVKNIELDGEPLGNSSFMPVGSIFASAIPQTDARVHLLDGSTISQTGVYETFANLIKELVSAGNNIVYEDDEELTAEQKFNADVTATGNCGKFIIDDVNGTIRLPKITTFIQGLSSITNIGSSLSAGLPNIVGSLDFSSSIGFPSSADNIDGSAITRRLSSRTSYMSSTSNTANRTHGINFDASRNNQIYGKSDTVQPPATQYPYYIVLASGYKSSQVIDIDNITTELNNKISKQDTRKLIEDLEGKNVYVETYDGTKYYPLAKFTKAVNEGTNSSFINISGKIGGWGADTGAYINVLLWGRDARGGSYIFSGDIINALTRQDIVMYEENSTSVVIYLKTVGYTNARLNIKTTASSGGTEILYNASSITTPTGTLIASMSNNKIKASAGQSVVLYDRTSSSSSLNWGKTGGIYGGITVTGKDFSKFSKLIIRAKFANAVTGVGELDLTTTISTGEYRGKLIFGSEEDVDMYTCYIKVNSDKTSFSNTQMGFIHGTTFNSRNGSSNSSYQIYKIEGVF